MPARKKTSDRVSSIAGRILRQLGGFKVRDAVVAETRVTYARRVCSVADLRALAASALSQDETPRKVAKRGKR